MAKYDASGNSLIWAIRMGGDSTVSYSTSGYYAYDLGSKVKLDSTGNVYVVGNYAGSSDFGTTINGTPITLTTAGDQDGFVVKLNSAGNVQWANRWGSTGNQVGTSVGIDGSGNVYVQGLRQDATNAKKGIDILKFNSTGSQVWSKSIDTNIANFGDMAVDSSGNVFAVADFNGTADFDPGPQTRRYSAGSFSKESGFVLKLTAQGNFGWVSIFRGGLASYSEAISVVLDGSGSNVVVGGYFAGPVDFDPGSGVKTLSNNGEYSAYITKLNSNNGSLVWAKSLTATSTSGGAGVKGLAIGPNDSIYVSGYYKGTVDFDPSSTSTYSRTGYMISPTVGSIDAFILNLDSSGNFGWVETFGGSGVQYANGIAVDASGTIYVSGTFVGTVDFDPGLGTENRSSSGALRSGFIARFRRS